MQLAWLGRGVEKTTEDLHKHTGREPLARVVPPARPSGTPAMVAWYAVFVSDDGTEVDIPEELVADCSPVLRRLLAKSCLSMFDSTEQRFREDCGIHELRCFKLVL